MVNRRRFLACSSLAALGLPMSTVAGSAYAAGDALRLGVPAPLSGVFAAGGGFASLGARMAAKQAARETGRLITTLDLDTEGKPAVAVRKVQDAMAQEGMRLFFGGILSSESLAMGKEIARGGGVFITATGADEITGSECNRRTFRWSVPTFGAINETVRPLQKLLPRAKRWYTITPQYVFGEGMMSAAKVVFAENNIEHVGNSYHTLTDREFSGYLTNALAAKPDVLLLLNIGPQASDTLRQAVSFGMKKRMTILVAWATGLDQFEALGPDICQDIYFGAQYWHAARNPFNNEFVARARKEEGVTPNQSVAASYICSKLLLDAAIRAGSLDGAVVAAALEGLRYDGPTGAEEIRAADHQVIKDYYLLKGKSKAAMRDKDDYADIIHAGKSFLSPEQAGCKMPR